MHSASTRRVVLLPLDAEMVRMRLDRQDFRLERSFEGVALALHFGAEFPGDALVLYPRLRLAIGDAGVVDGTFVVVDRRGGEVVGQIGSIGAPDGPTVEIGYGINASAEGRGVATASVAMLVEILRHRRVETIVARTSVANVASARVLEKNGFDVTGSEPSDEGELLLWALATMS